MKRLKIIFTAIISLWAICSNSLRAQESDKFEIIGYGKFPNQKVFLMYYDYNNGDKIVDSVLIKGDKFQFNGKIDGPSYDGIIFGDNFNQAANNWSLSSNIWFTIFEGETKIAFGDGRPVIKEGNKGLGIEKAYKSIIQEKRSVFISPSYKSDVAKIDSLRKEIQIQDSLLVLKYGRKEDVDYKVLSDFISKYPNEKYALHLFKEYLNNIDDYDVAFSLYNQLGDNLKKSQLGTQIAQRIETFKIKEGVDAIPFSQETADGKLISLSDFRGKYLLIDFWASWCVPCRAENPNVVKAYEKFKGKNFEILGVSLDNKKENWKGAIAADGLTWPQVSDLKGWKNEVAVLYGIRAIPSNFLVDPNGKIVAKDLRGEDLEKTLERFIK